MFVTPWRYSKDPTSHPSVVPDSNPQLRQLAPDVQLTALTPW